MSNDYFNFFYLFELLLYYFVLLSSQFGVPPIWQIIIKMFSVISCEDLWVYYHKVFNDYFVNFIICNRSPYRHIKSLEENSGLRSVFKFPFTFQTMSLTFHNLPCCFCNYLLGFYHENLLILSQLHLVL